MPAAADRTRPGWSAMAPVKLPRRWPNSWLSASSRVVVVQLYGRNIAELRGEPTCIARATSSLPVPLSPVTRTVRSFPCSRVIWSTTRCIAALAQRKPGSSGSRERLACSSATRSGRSLRGAQLEALAGDRDNHPQAALGQVPGGSRRHHHDQPAPVRLCPEPVEHQRAARGLRLRPAAGEGAGGVGFAPHVRDDARLSAGGRPSRRARRCRRG